MNVPRYVSTRGGTAPVSFSEAVLTGLAPDGGLLVPEHWPDIRPMLDEWSGLAYPDLALEVMRLFSDLPDSVLREVVRASYRPFDHPDIAPCVPVGERHVLELFHGPTLAFKDMALQLLGRLYAHLLEVRDERLNIIGATSGDTGSAAIHAMRGLDRVRILILHPAGRIARAQALQMTTVLDPNVFNVAMEGTFDDCQSIMKRLFSDTAFKARYALGSVNSVNWIRILGQIIYYIHAALRLRSRGERSVRFAVPTGNFGNVLAGWYAARMGLPVSRLIAATNENDILARFFMHGVYERGPVHATVSPSMDIQVASNFERYLYARLGDDPVRTRDAILTFERTGHYALPGCDTILRAHRVDTDATLSTIRDVHHAHGYVLDPHTAVGMHAALQEDPSADPIVVLATAHPAKFPDAIRRATGQDLAHHPALDALENKPVRCDSLPHDENTVRRYIADRFDDPAPSGTPPVRL